MKNIVVIGGGYTGVLCAVRLGLRTRKLDVTITLVNPSDRFTERLRTHQVAAGHELADFRIPDLVGERVTFVRGWATAIDTAAREVMVSADDGLRKLPYDRLVYALGSYTDTSVVPGAADHAYTLDDPRLAHRMARRLASLDEAGGDVAVCGGGLTGVEAAAEIAENHPNLRVSLISSKQPAQMMGKKARAYVFSAFERLGVTVHAGAPVAKVLPDGVELADGRVIPADVSLWTAGVRPHALAAEAGIGVDDRGLVLVDPALRSLTHPEIYAVGDAAAARQAWGQIHGTCQSGLPTAAHAADSIARELRGRKVEPFRFGYFHQPLSLGRRDAVIQFTRHDDTPGRFYLKGRAAVKYKEWVSSTPPKAFVKTQRYPAPVVLSRGGRATRKPFMEL